MVSHPNPETKPEWTLIRVQIPNLSGHSSGSRKSLNGRTASSATPFSASSRSSLAASSVTSLTSSSVTSSATLPAVYWPQKAADVRCVLGKDKHLIDCREDVSSLLSSDCRRRGSTPPQNVCTLRVGVVMFEWRTGYRLDTDGLFACVRACVCVCVCGVCACLRACVSEFVRKVLWRHLRDMFSA